jgi:flavin-dependent dehydrogenase
MVITSANQLNGQSFDIVIVGAGPAGCHCARLLAKAGYQVLLVEQHKDFYKNNFSSAATPLETLEKFDLPEEVVGSSWSKIEIITTKVYRSWESSQSLGVVFDFAKLRQFLAEDCQANGGQVWLGYRYLKYTQENGKILVYLKKRNGDITYVSSKVLVDATGFARAVIYPDKKARPNFLKATGIEYLIEVPQEKHQNYANSLIFFLGHYWSPKGYSWIFPMDNNQLKVGSAWLDEPHKILDSVKPLKEYIQQIIKDYIQIDNYKIIDVHGSILEYSIGLNDLYYRDNIIAIGDAVSTVNFLGGEGIRHGMDGAEIAARHIEDYLNQKTNDFRGYQTEMQQHFSRQWNSSEQISRRVYLEYSDARIDRGVAYLKYLNLQDIIDILFYYKFQKYLRGFQPYLLKKLISWLKQIRLLAEVRQKAKGKSQ